jgi:hypothetical protein
MAKTVYKWTSKNQSAPYYGPTVIVDSEWPANVRDMWLAALKDGYAAPTAPFKPTFDQKYIYTPDNNGGMVRYPVDKYMTPTMATVQALALMFAVNGQPLVIHAVPSLLGGGPVVSDGETYLLQFPNGETMVAGVLAEFFDKNNDEENPGWAMTLAKNAIRKIYPQFP